MALPRSAHGILAPVLLLILIAWVVELGGLFYLQKSCKSHAALSPWWAQTTGAGLPQTNSCSKLYRYHWWAVWFEFPLVLAIIGSIAGFLGSGNNLLQRYRLGIIGLLAVVTSLQMWSANVTLNLTDTLIRKAEDDSEVMRARVTFFGFAALSALNAVLIFILGDDGPSASASGNEPLIGGDA